jgi:hypothetical protein
MKNKQTEKWKKRAEERYKYDRIKGRLMRLILTKYKNETDNKNLGLNRNED